MAEEAARDQATTAETGLPFAQSHCEALVREGDP